MKVVVDKLQIQWRRGWWNEYLLMRSNEIGLCANEREINLCLGGGSREQD